MASVGGRTTIECTSQSVDDFNCSVCERDDKHVEALNACVECGENLCSACLRDHNRFERMRSHNILDKEGMAGRSSGETLPIVFMQKCMLHEGEAINMYCGAHDEVCCGACITITHRLCKGVDYLPLVAKGIKTSNEIGDVKNDLQKLQVELIMIKKIREEDLVKLDEEKNKVFKDIDNFREEIVTHLDTMVTKAKDEASLKHSKLKKETETKIQALDKMNTLMAANTKHLDTSQGQHEAQVFLHVKQGKQIKTDGRKLLQGQNVTRTRKTFNCLINNNIKENFMNLKSLGDIQVIKEDLQIEIGDDRLQVSATCEASLNGKFNMKLEYDGNDCAITDVCILENGYTVITDQSNSKLKLLDQAYKVIDSCCAISEPCCVCSTGPSEVAVVNANNQKIQFVSISTENKLILTRFFSTDNLGTNTSIEFSKGELFVCSVNYSCMVTNYYLAVYNLTGEHLYKIGLDKVENQILLNFKYIAANCDGSIVYISTGSGVDTMNRQTGQLSKFAKPNDNLVGITGICPLDNGNMLVAGQVSNNIVQMDKYGKMSCIILSETDGIHNPQGLYYNRANSQLIVTFESNHIQVYDLARC